MITGNFMDVMEEAHGAPNMSYLANLHHHYQMDFLLKINLIKQPLYNLVNEVHLLSNLDGPTLFQNNL